MNAFILLCCTAAAFLIYIIGRSIFAFLILPLTSRIPTGAEYRPNIGGRGYGANKMP